MKSIATAILLFLFTQSGIAQDSVITSDNHHEVGVDISPFLQRFVSGNIAGNYSPFFVMYRYHFNNWNIRTGIGGTLRKQEDVLNDTSIYTSENSSFIYRLGVERKIDFYRRWQFYYGLDLYTYSETRIYERIEGSTFSDNDRNKENGYGVAPLMGLRFKINDRISFTTESSLVLYYFKARNERTYSLSPQTDRITSTEGWRTSFSPPTSIFFTFNF